MSRDPRKGGNCTERVEWKFRQPSGKSWQLTASEGPTGGSSWMHIVALGDHIVAWRSRLSRWKSTGGHLKSLLTQRKSLGDVNEALRKALRRGVSGTVTVSVYQVEGLQSRRSWNGERREWGDRARVENHDGSLKPIRCGFLYCACRETETS